MQGWVAEIFMQLQAGGHGNVDVPGMTHLHRFPFPSQVPCMYLGKDRLTVGMPLAGMLSCRLAMSTSG